MSVSSVYEIGTGSPKYAIMVKEITNDAATRLICWLALGTVTTNGGDLTVTANAEGLLQLA